MDGLQGAGLLLRQPTGHDAPVRGCLWGRAVIIESAWQPGRDWIRQATPSSASKGPVVPYQGAVHTACVERQLIKQSKNQQAVPSR